MGGHGGLNILPQKKWNVYNWDNRIKVMENEKIVNKEIEKMERKKKDKRLIDTVKHLKSDNKDSSGLNFNNFNSEVDDKEKNRIFKEVMSRQSMKKRLNVDLMFEKMNTQMKPEDKVLVKEEIKGDDSEKVDNVTFKESIKNHLNPWWMKKQPDDYKIYREHQQNIITAKTDVNIPTEYEEDPLLNKKRSKEKKSHKEKKHKKDKSKEKTKTCNTEKLREERLIREMLEQERIKKFLNSKN